MKKNQNLSPVFIPFILKPQEESTEVVLPESVLEKIDTMNKSQNKIECCMDSECQDSKPGCRECMTCSAYLRERGILHEPATEDHPA